MSLEIRVLTGAKAGLVLRFAGRPVTVGRHPDADIRFGPDTDLEVSARHAVLTPEADRWLLRDLDSRNGTYLNGQRISPESPLHDGDRISFGAHGPTVEVRLVEAGTAGAAPDTRVERRAAAGGGGAAASDAAESALSTTGRIRVEVVRRTRRLYAVLAVVIGLSAATVGAVLHLRRGEMATWDRERADLNARIDSILVAGEAAIRSLEGELEALAAALRRSQEQVRTLDDSLERARSRGDGEQVAVLQRRLQAATLALERQQLAATLDFRAIERRNRPAVALVYVESSDGVVKTGTAFAVRPDATLVTSRHVLAGPDGRDHPRRIAIQFSDSEQVWPARILAIAASSDLALVKVDNILGEVPTVQGLDARSDTVAMGAPVASIGYPLGGAPQLPGSRAERLARPLVSAGVVTESARDRLAIQGYGAAGASGSPLFDASGEVIAVIFGGRDGPAGHTVLAVPASEVVRFLNATR